jgi:phage minor structural protein
LEFSGTPEEFLTTIIDKHNTQVDEAKKFKLGRVTVTKRITVDSTAYESSHSVLTKTLLESSGGYLFVTHGEDGTEDIPTLNYFKDFETVSSQPIEFGVNLKQYTKKSTSSDIKTAIIPLGAENEETKVKLNITSVTSGRDFVHDSDAVNRYGWIFDVVEYPDITDAQTLKTTAENDLKNKINSNITIELTAIDLHLLDRSIESYKLGDYIPARSKPHNFSEVMLCSKQTIDLLKPDNDTVTLGHTYANFTEKTSTYSNIATSINKVYANVTKLNTVVNATNKNTQDLADTMSGSLDALNQAIADLTARVVKLEKK